jgi:hypothetical protein
MDGNGDIFNGVECIINEKKTRYCNTCIYNNLKKPCNLKERVIKENLNCGYYLGKLK